MKYLAENIKYLRNKLGISQEKLAEMMGMNRGNIASYEKGMAEPRIENLLKLMTIFKVELNDLVKKDLRVLEKIDQEVERLKTIPETRDSDRSKKRAELLSRLVVEDDKLANFIDQSSEMQKILEGFKSFHKMKMKDGHSLSDDVKRISDDYEKLLEVMEEMIQANKVMVQFLVNNK